MVSRFFLFAISIFLSAAASFAQTWQARTADTGSLLIGSAYLEGSGISFSCTAPSPAGRPLIETGSHETRRNGPYQLTVQLADQLFQWQPPYRQDNVVLWLGQTGYRLPPVQLDELFGTGVDLAMSDQMVLALFGAKSLVLDTGQGARHAYSVGNLAEALRISLGYCASRWTSIGYPVPSELNGVVVRAAPVPTPNPVRAAPPPFITNLVSRTCGPGGFAIDHKTAFGEGDFDGDGAPDYILSGYGVRCYGKLNPWCGASQCSVEVYLSSRGYADADGWLGGGFAIGRSANGRAGFYRFGDTSRPLEIWNGTAFVPSN